MSKSYTAHYTVHRDENMVSPSSNVAMQSRRLHQIDSASISSNVVSKHVPDDENTFSCHHNLSVPANGQLCSASSHGYANGYDNDTGEWLFSNSPCNARPNSVDSPVNRTTPMSIDANSCPSNNKILTSDESSIDWKTGKKKDTVGAALLIALGIAGIVIG